MPWLVFVYVLIPSNLYARSLTHANTGLSWAISQSSAWTKVLHNAPYINNFSISHIIRAVYGFSYETMEVTGPQMVLTMKLTTFAWNVYDGRRKVEVRNRS